MFKVGDEEFVRILGVVDERLGDGKVRPTDRHGRLRICSRCDALSAEYERLDPSWVAPIAQSWVRGGIVYWSGLCEKCGALDVKKRQAAQAEAARAEEVQEKRPQIGMRGRVFRPAQPPPWER